MRIYLPLPIHMRNEMSIFRRKGMTFVLEKENFKLIAKVTNFYLNLSENFILEHDANFVLRGKNKF